MTILLLIYIKNITKCQSVFHGKGRFFAPRRAIVTFLFAVATALSGMKEHVRLKRVESEEWREESEERRVKRETVFKLEGKLFASHHTLSSRVKWSESGTESRDLGCTIVL